MKSNTKFKFAIFLSCCFTILFTLSCETTRETYNEFILDGETIYIGKADSILIGEGYKKLRFWVAINADPKISKGILKTIDESVYHEFEITRSKSGKDTISFDLDLDEGEYNFGLFLLDDNGNKSVRVEVPATVYGEKYKSGLINRGIINIETYEDKAIVTWASASESILETKLTYDTQAGTSREMVIPNDNSSTVLNDYKKGGNLSIKSTHRPTSSAIEDFEAIPTQTLLPEEYILDKSKMTALRLTGDATDGCYGSSYERLLDGSVSTGYWHSCNEPADQYPWVMSFDLSEPQIISKFGLDERQDCCGERSPAKYQIWATNNLSGANTSNIDDVPLDQWENEANEKGWVKILDIEGNTENSFLHNIQENNSKYRYIRVVGISSIGGGIDANFNEITFWGK